MPLQGDFREFGAPELFQFLEQQAKSGCLQVDAGEATLEVFFRSGKIVGVLPAGSDQVRQVLVTLCRLGTLSETDADRIGRRRQMDLRSLRQILQHEGIVESAELETLFRRLIEESVHPLFRLRSGRFSFDPDRRLSAELELVDPIGVEPLVLDGLRRVDEWPMLRKRVGSFRGVPERRFAPGGLDAPSLKSKWALFHRGRRRRPASAGEDAFDPESDASLSTAEKVLYRCIDGKRSIETLIGLAALGEYGTCKALLSLVDRGLVQLASPFPAAPIQTRGRLAARIGAWCVSLFLFTFLAGALLSSPALREHAGETGLRGELQQGGKSLCRLINDQRRRKILETLEIYRAEQGEYPGGLADLVRARLLYPEELEAMGPNQFSYILETPQSYRLHVAPAY
ncbi:MAG: DUF4388 domain-containing protein [bacterium]